MKPGKTRLGACAALLAAVAAPGAGLAQEGWYVVPSISVAGVLDDNVFFDSSNELSDAVARISPALYGGYRSATFSMDGFYSFDSELYADNSDQNSVLLRQSGEVETEYLVSNQLSLSGDLTYDETRTPGDLNTAASGFQLSRINAQRYQINPGLTYRFNNQWNGSMEYAYSNDQLAGGIEGEVHRAQAEIRRTFLNENLISLSYLYREYLFSNGAESYSHTPILGLGYNFSSRTGLTLRGGMRMGEDNDDPYALASIFHTYGDGRLDLTYVQDETTLIGEAGRLETENVSAGLLHRFGPRLSMEIRPTYSTVTGPEDEAEVFGATLGADYRYSDSLTFFFEAEHSNQEESFTLDQLREVKRNYVLFGFTWTLPNPYLREEEDAFP